MKKRTMRHRPTTVEVYTTDLDALNQVIRDLNSLHGSQTCHVSREITRLEHITARMNPAPDPARRLTLVGA